MAIAQDRQDGARGGRLGKFVRHVVGVRGDLAGCVLADHLAQCVAFELDRLAESVRTSGQAARLVVGVGEGTVVEVRLRDEAACRVVVVTPGQALGVGDLDEVEFLVVGELVAHPVRARAGRQQVEVGVLEAGDAAQRVGVARAVALAVVRPGLRRAVRCRAAGQVALGRPLQAGRRTQCVGECDRSAETVTFVAGDPAEGVRDPQREAGVVAVDRRGLAERVGHRREVARLVVGEVGGVALRVRHRGAVAAVVVRLAHGRAVRVHQPCGQAEFVVLGSRLTSVGAGDGEQVAVLVVAERRGVAERVRAGQQAVVAVASESGDPAQRVHFRDHLAGAVDQVPAGVALAGGGGRHPVAGFPVRLVVGEAQGHVAVRAALGDAAVLVVVLVRVAAAVGVRPGDDAALAVVGETQGRPEELVTSVRLPSV